MPLTIEDEGAPLTPPTSITPEPPSPSPSIRERRLQDRNNKEFIRRLANDYIHFKIHGPNSHTQDMEVFQDSNQSLLSPRSPRVNRFQSTSTGAYSERSSVSDSNNNMVHSPTLSEPSDDVIDDQISNQEPFRKASRVLRKVSVELERSNSAFFENVCEDLSLNNTDARTAFRNVSDRVLDRDSLNWGRVVSVFTFGGKLAEWFWNSHQEERIDEVEEWLAESLSSKESWIEENGGWEYFAEKFEKDREKDDTNFNWLKPGLLMCVGVSLAAIFSMKMQ
ncbi:bcl-2-like protein 1 [Clytia hemisphaerica]|uniref:Bcl-2 Bcl-2 homology region 1-3 domain-containing protein n=1 Tax=Clytia hemisphaerica TaxID=252671 RepID=A0A7M5WJ94_9CNID|eukprot:TCONS_00004487-protein